MRVVFAVEVVEMRVTYGANGAVLRLDLAADDYEFTCYSCGAAACLVNGVPMHESGWLDDDHQPDEG